MGIGTIGIEDTGERQAGARALSASVSGVEERDVGNVRRAVKAAPGKLPVLREIRSLLRVVEAAPGKLPGPWLLLPSVLGWPNSFWPERYSEHRLLYSLNLLRTLRYLADVLVPSVPVIAPEWFPEPLAPFFFHPSRVDQHPDQYKSWTSHPREAWLFVNGILTDDEVAQLNAAYLADLFHRPSTLIQNSTDGFVWELAECADEKAFGQTGEAATVAFPAIYDAVKDPEKERVVVVAHSQGTLIAAVVLRLMEFSYRPGRGLPAARRERKAVRTELRSVGVGLDLEEFEAVGRHELAKLELYCFANCATKMRYVDATAQTPWIESFGNEYDVVARLGMLAPDPTKRGLSASMWSGFGSVPVRPGDLGGSADAHDA